MSFVLVGRIYQGDAELAHVAHALGAFGVLADLAHGGDEDGGQDADDRDDGKQFNKSETTGAGFHGDVVW